MEESSGGLANHGAELGDMLIEDGFSIAMLVWNHWAAGEPGRERDWGRHALV